MSSARYPTTPDHTKMATTTTKSKSPESESLIEFTETTEHLVDTATAEWRRRKVTGEDSRLRPRTPPSRQQSFRDDFGHAAAETYLITRLSFSLLSYLGLPVVNKVIRPWLLCFATNAWVSSRLFSEIMPMKLTTLQLLLQWDIITTSPARFEEVLFMEINQETRLDLYLPKDSDGQKPVLIFVTGGAWIIGYKAWGSFLGLQLAERDIIVACLDYRNFPQGMISDMVEDVSQGISFVFSHIAEYGGDPNRIYLMGQSAGAHISACALVEQAMKESEGKSNSWSVSQIKCYFGASGGYNLLGLVDHFDNRGLYRSIFLSKDFVDALKSVDAEAELILFDGKTHTDLFLQDPLRGGKDEMFRQLLSVIHAGDAEALAKDAIAPPNRRFVPEILLKLAHEISPF
ncbi:putative isoprenylcysteine alpha-carbonyl methylesterase ICMEL2 [Drosera capensis]